MITKNIINENKIFLGIDFGAKKIGISVGQLITKQASPLKIIFNNKNKINWDDIDKIIQEWKPDIIVVGYPYSNSKNTFTKLLDDFILNLTNKYINSVKIIKFSEVLSTEESKILYSEIRKSEYNIGKKENLDDLSASIILQSWFNENMIT
jgi:putative Holliday junction resolvase|tara:strand:- start:946 stop:1398 length:453 start_codon:yes stop_codon:yes gene_type:complete